MIKNLVRLISFKTDRPTGINAARNWLINWSRKNNLSLTVWENNHALLIETNPGKMPHLSFIAHIDVVPANNWANAFKAKVTASTITGRGAVDDKGPLAVCLNVLLNVKNENCNTSLLIVADEETNNQEINQIINSGRFKPDFCLVADGGEMNKFDVGQKGNLWLNVTVKTKGGHAAFAKKGQNAANILNEFIAILQTWSQNLPHHKLFSPAFINISKLQSNTAPLNMPVQANAQIQISFPPPQTARQWLDKIDQFKNIRTQVIWENSPHLLTDKKWLNLIKKTLRSAKLITSGAPNLAHDLILHKIPAISHCPTWKYLAHCHKESIRIKDLALGKKLYILLVKNFAKMR